MKKLLLTVLILLLLLGFSSWNDVCSLQSLGLSSYEALYKDLKEPPKSDEDLGRYIWYGRRQFTWWVYGIFSIFWNGCHSLYKDAKILCENFENIKSVKDKNQLISQLNTLLERLPKNSEWYLLTKKLYEDILNYSWLKQDTSYLLKIFSNDILHIENYYKYRNILVDTKEKKVYIPYTWLVPVNIVYNWTLQNLSSYYTDIWFIWLIIWIIVLLSLIYSIFTRNKILFAISSASVFWYIVWWFVWSAILWYGIWIVIWSILVNVIFFYYLIRDLWKYRFFWYVVVLLYSIFFFWQLFLNFVRISSQGGWWPFVWYKENNGYEQFFSEYLQPGKELVFPYKRKNVFNLQFPHYNKLLSVANFTWRDYNIFLAWTYARYFIKNQKGVIYDQMLGSLWKWMSDWDVCKTYLRIFKDKKIKYIAIDPNIWTVVMGWWNKTLFDRFFGNINLDTWSLQWWGVLTFLGKLYESGYVKYFYSNNIAAKYGFVLSDEELKRYLRVFNPNLSDVSKEDIAILRWSLVALRYPWIWRLLFKKFISNDERLLASNKQVDVYLYNFWISFISNILIDRIKSWDIVGDIADIYGKQIDKNRVLTLYLAYQKGFKKQVVEGIKYLDQDERFILYQVINLFELLKSW